MSDTTKFDWVQIDSDPEKMPILIIYIGNTNAKCGFCGLWFVLFVHHFLTTHTCARIPYTRAHIPSHMATVL